VFDEICSEIGIGFAREIGYRDNERWSRAVESIKLDQSFSARDIEEGNVYFITGGLGGLGLSLAKSFAKKAKSKIALVSRKSLPDRSMWESFVNDHPDDKQAFIITRLLELEALGSEIMVCSSDVTDSELLTVVLDQVCHQFGQINTVIHSAGMPGGGIIDFKTPEMVEKVFASKLQGTLVLANAMKTIKPDQLIFCSSTSAIYGESSQVDYTAANAFLDAYAQYFERMTGIKTVSINWMRWNELGMAEETEVPDAMVKERDQARLYGVSPEDGVELFDRIMASGLHQVITSKTDVEFDVLSVEKEIIEVAKGALLIPKTSSTSNKAPLATSIISFSTDNTSNSTSVLLVIT
jgi:NAD(P)-dependent dehydrogenase (short-subunit alcohol dehydrogenase family)